MGRTERERTTPFVGEQHQSTCVNNTQADLEQLCAQRWGDLWHDHYTKMQFSILHSGTTETARLFHTFCASLLFVCLTYLIQLLFALDTIEHELFSLLILSQTRKEQSDIYLFVIVFLCVEVVLISWTLPHQPPQWACRHGYRRRLPPMPAPNISSPGAKPHTRRSRQQTSACKLLPKKLSGLATF